MKDDFDAGRSADSRRSSGRRASSQPRLDRLLAALLALITFGSVLAVGTVHTSILLVVTALSCAAGALAMKCRDEPGLPAPAWILAGLAAYSALQAVPLPMRWLATLSPVAADVWARSLLPLGEAAPSYASLSLDPGASLREAAKWLSYSAVFVCAVTLAKRRGTSWVVGLVFMSALTVAVLTLLHGVLGATQVYGAYAPRYPRGPWHTAPLLNANNLAGYLNLGALCGLGLLLDGRRRMPFGMVLVGTAMIVAMEVVTGSRGGQLALLCAVLLLLVIVARRRSFQDKLRFRFGSLIDIRLGSTAIALVWMFVVVAVVGGGVLLAWIGRGQSVLEELEQGGLEKLELVSAVKPMLVDFPWFGVGRGAFQDVFAAYRTSPGNVVYTHPENFVAQWLAEWGLVVGFTGLCALAWTLRPSELRMTRSTLRIGAAAGVLAVLLQNLVDLGLELPGVAIAVSCVLGALWGSSRARLTSGHSALSSAAPWVFACAGATCVLLVLMFGRHDVVSEREQFHARYRQLDVRNAGVLKTLRAELGRSMQRHPAEAYFPRFGALVAFQARDSDPMPWIQRALERSLSDGRTHYLLAEVLARRGAKHQALMELRLAAMFDAELITAAARRAVKWASSYEELARAVPDGIQGEATLSSMAGRLKDAELKRRCLAEALRRNPSAVYARLMLANELVAALVADTDGSPCSGARREGCIREVEAHASHLTSDLPHVSTGIQLKARLLVALGQLEQAEAVLAKGCDDYRDRATCLYVRLDLVMRLKDSEIAESVARRVLATECAVGQAACAAASESIGDLAARQGQALLAVRYYTRAAREDPSAQRWQKLASSASRTGMHSQAIHALREAGRLTGGSSATLQRDIAAEEERALRNALDGPK